jgi:hypothetical protein
LSCLQISVLGPPITARSTEVLRPRTESGPKYWVRPDHPVRTSHGPAAASRATFRVRATAAILERRERVAPLSSTLLVAVAPGVPNVKQSVKSRLFGIAVTLSLFAAFVSPMLGKRW